MLLGRPSAFPQQTAAALEQGGCRQVWGSLGFFPLVTKSVGKQGMERPPDCWETDFVAPRTGNLDFWS